MDTSTRGRPQHHSHNMLEQRHWAGCCSANSCACTALIPESRAHPGKSGWLRQEQHQQPPDLVLPLCCRTGARPHWSPRHSGGSRGQGASWAVTCRTLGCAPQAAAKPTCVWVNGSTAACSIWQLRLRPGWTVLPAQHKTPRACSMSTANDPVFCNQVAPAPVRASCVMPPVCSRQSLQQAGPCFVQVGSKNAAFFMGRCIKLSTRRANSAYVHELRIAAAELEQRYKNAEVNWAGLQGSMPARHLKKTAMQLCWPLDNSLSWLTCTAGSQPAAGSTHQHLHGSL